MLLILIPLILGGGLGKWTALQQRFDDFLHLGIELFRLDGFVNEADFAGPGGVDALGRPKKRAFGPWMLKAFGVLAKFKFLRGTPLDIFGRSADRKLERDLIGGYEKDVATVLNLLSPLNHDIAVELLSLPERIRGYGPVKDKAVKEAKVR